MGILTSSAKERLESLKAQKKELLASIPQIELERPVYCKEAIVKLIHQFKGATWTILSIRSRSSTFL